MPVIRLEDSSANLKELVHRLVPGEAIVITENQKPVARLVSEQSKPAGNDRPAPGLLKGAITYMAPDFNEPLEDMKEYM